MIYKKKVFIKYRQQLIESRSRNPVCGVYSITCTETGKCYIGSSTDIERRWKIHCWELCQRKHGNKKLQDTWNKYGQKSLKLEVLYDAKGIIPKEELRLIEQTYFDRFHPELNIVLDAFWEPPPNRVKRFSGHRKLKKSKLRK